MSARGVKGSSVAGGGTDGSDFAHRQVLAPRYEAMAGYRAQLGLLFTYLPFFYLTSIILTAIHFQSPSLKSLTAVVLPFPFWFGLVGTIVTAALVLRAIQLQASMPAMVMAGLATVYIAYITILYTLQAINGAPVWYVLGAMVNGLILVLNSLAIYDGYMIILLQGSKKKY